MSRPCSICTHPDHRAIDRRLLEGIPAARVAKEFDAPLQGMQRHARNHLKPVVQLTSQLAKVARPSVQQVEETMALVPHAIDLQQTLAVAIKDTQRIQQEMEQDGDKRGALGAIEALRKHLETAQRITGMGAPHAGPSITQEQVHTEVRALLSDFAPAPEEARQWAAQNLLAGMPLETMAESEDI